MSARRSQTKSGITSKPASSTARRGLTSSEKTELTEIFALCDSDSSGYLDWAELRRALRGLGFAVSKREARALLRQQDRRTELGFIDIAQFLDIVETLASHDHGREREIIGGFRLFDTAGKNHITAEDLRRLCAEVGEEFKKADIEEMIRLADLNGDGKVDLEEFTKVMLLTNLFRDGPFPAPKKTAGDAGDGSAE